MDFRRINALICLRDDAGIEYAISQIEYTIWQNEEFEYRFRPNYSVIDLLDASLFQGIPGIDLTLKKEEYVRVNTVPVFISERAPSPNRQELWKLLEDCGMHYLNQLEWLIKTETKYIGDRLYVRAPYEQNFSDIINFNREASQIKRETDAHKRLLVYICAGFSIDYDGFLINDSNRKTCFELLYRLFRRETDKLKRLQRNGIEQAQKDGKYSGRKSINIDDTKLYEVWRKYDNRKITLEEATRMLGISTSTFYRRIKRFSQERKG